MEGRREARRGAAFPRLPAAPAGRGMRGACCEAEEGRGPHLCWSTALPSPSPAPGRPVCPRPARRRDRSAGKVRRSGAGVSGRAGGGGVTSPPPGAGRGAPSPPVPSRPSPPRGPGLARAEMRTGGGTGGRSAGGFGPIPGQSCPLEHCYHC